MQPAVGRICYSETNPAASEGGTLGSTAVSSLMSDGSSVYQNSSTCIRDDGNAAAKALMPSSVTSDLRNRRNVSSVSASTSQSDRIPWLSRVIRRQLNLVAMITPGQVGNIELLYACFRQHCGKCTKMGRC